MSATEDRYLAMAITDAEAPHLGKTATDLRVLADELLAAGYTDTEVRGLVGWLVLKSAGQRDRSGKSTRAKYRKMLASIQRPQPRWPGTAAMTIMLVTVVVGASLISGRRGRLLFAQRLDITTIVGADLVLIVLVIESPAVDRVISEKAPADIHTLPTRWRPDLHTVSTLPKAA